MQLRLSFPMFDILPSQLNHKTKHVALWNTSVLDKSATDGTKPEMDSFAVSS